VLARERQTRLPQSLLRLARAPRQAAAAPSLLALSAGGLSLRCWRGALVPWSDASAAIRVSAALTQACLMERMRGGRAPPCEAAAACALASRSGRGQLHGGRLWPAWLSHAVIKSVIMDCMAQPCRHLWSCESGFVASAIQADSSCQPEMVGPGRVFKQRLATC